MLIQSLESNSWYPHLASSLLRTPQAFLKTKCAECGGSCGLAKKYKETMAVAWPMIFAVFLVMGDFLLDDKNEVMKQKNEHQKASVGLLSVILFWELGFRMRFGPHLSKPWLTSPRPRQAKGFLRIWVENCYQIYGWVVVSNIFYFHPYLGKFPIWLIFFKVVETTNQIEFLWKTQRAWHL